jgi:hypothetical protein
MATVFPLYAGGKAHFHDSQGNPLQGGLVYFYITGTSTPKTTYSESTGTTTNSNPVELDSRGEADIYLLGDAAYKMVVNDSADALVYSRDPVTGIVDKGILSTAAEDALEDFLQDDTNEETSPVFNDRIPIRDTSGADLNYVTLLTLAKLTNPFVPVNCRIVPSVASNALTLAIKGQDGNDPSASNAVLAPLRSSTATSGLINWRTITSALSVVISSGSTLGHNDALKQYTYVYLIDNSGTLELAVSSKFFGLHGIVSTTAEGGAGAADSGTAMYSTTARSSVPFICIGYLEDTQTVAGTWTAAPSTVHNAPFSFPTISFSAHKNASNQASVVSGAATKVTFGTEIYDNGGLFDAATNYRWVPPPGTVTLTGSFGITVSVDQTYLMAIIEKNGSIFKRVSLLASGTDPESNQITIQDECNGTDYYELFIQHGAGSDRTIDGATVLTYFMGSWSPYRS